MTGKDLQQGLLKDKNLYLIFATTLLAVMGVASIAPAFPQMVEHFRITKQQVALLVVAFTIPGIFLTPFTGIIADRVGRKAILIPSLFIFGIAGFSCIFIDNFHLLIIARFIQGLGAASLGALNITLIGDLYQGNKRAEAMGYNASVLSVGTATYPALGGFLAVFGWNFPFILPILAIPLGIVIALKLDNPEPEKHSSLRQYGKSLLKTINQKQVYGFFILNILIFFLIYGTFITYLPILLKDRLRAVSWQIGLTMSCMSVTTAATSTQAGRINRMLKTKKILVIGVSLYIVSMVLFAYSGSWLSLVLPVLLFGFGQGFFLPTVQTKLVSLAPLKERAAFMSLNSMVLRIGQTIGPAVIGFAYSLGGIKSAYLGGALVAVTMLLVIILFVRNEEQVPLNR